MPSGRCCEHACDGWALRRMQDGLWVSPRPPGELLHEALDDLGVGSCAVFVADPVPGPDRLDPLSAWDLDEARAAYAAFVDEFTPVSGEPARAAA